MKNGKLQCKDIPDEPILRFLAKQSRWATYYRNEVMPAIEDAMPPELDRNLMRAKMEMLIRRGLADGCTCGCRGDFRLTAKGERFLEALDNKGVLLE